LQKNHQKLHKNCKEVTKNSILACLQRIVKLFLSQEGRNLLRKLATHLGLSQTAVIELAIRQLAEQEKFQH
jgi:hypothetical protein